MSAASASALVDDSKKKTPQRSLQRVNVCIYVVVCVCGVQYCVVVVSTR